MIVTAIIDIIVYVVNTVLFLMQVIFIPSNILASFIDAINYFIAYIMIFEPIFPVHFLLSIMTFNMAVLASVLSFRIVVFCIMILRGGHYSPGEIK